MRKTNIVSFLALIVVLVIACTKKTKSPDNGVQPKQPDLSAMMSGGGADSPFIAIDSANRMISSFLGGIANPPSGTAAPLRSLTIDAEALRYYLSNTNIKNVKIMLAHRLDYINNGNFGVPAGYRSDALTIVIAGYDVNNNYVYTPANTALDNARPCPYHCPSSGTAASDLLQ